MKRFVVFLSTLFSSVMCWNLSDYNISSGYYVSSVAAYRNRAFLALPRSASCNFNISYTLVEASWYTEQQTHTKKTFFYDFQDWNSCDHLQDAISLDIETLKSRLWVLDKGNVNCRGKIVIYNLLQKINYTTDLPDVAFKKLNYVIVDTDFKMKGPRAYVGLDGENYLLVFSFNEFQWWRINLQSVDPSWYISTKYLAISKKESTLYFTGSEERAIFSLKLSSVREYFTKDIEYINATFQGEKLGLSSALAVDLKGGIYYYMPLDYAVVRWDTRYSSVAEHYSIIAQSYEILPYVSQLYTGPHNGILALVNTGDLERCDEQNSLILKRRLIKLLKYNFLL